MSFPFILYFPQFLLSLCFLFLLLLLVLLLYHHNPLRDPVIYMLHYFFTIMFQLRLKYIVHQIRKTKNYNVKYKILNIFCKCWQRPISTIHFTSFFYMNKQDHHKRYSDYKLTPLHGFGHQLFLSTAHIVTFTHLLSKLFILII